MFFFFLLVLSLWYYSYGGSHADGIFLVFSWAVLFYLIVVSIFCWVTCTPGSIGYFVFVLFYGINII